MIIHAIDPGPITCGVVIYDTDARAVIACDKAQPVEVVLRAITATAARGNQWIVACERVQSYGIAGSSLLQTAESFGRIWDRAEGHGLPFVPLYRREVLRELDLLGAKGNRDSAVRLRMLEMHGGRERALGSKATPGPLYGVTSHAWQALGLACAAASMLDRGALELSSAVEISGG